MSSETGWQARGSYLAGARAALPLALATVALATHRPGGDVPLGVHLGRVHLDAGSL